MSTVVSCPHRPEVASTCTGFGHPRSPFRPRSGSSGESLPRLGRRRWAGRPRPRTPHRAPPRRCAASAVRQGPGRPPIPAMPSMTMSAATGSARACAAPVSVVLASMMTALERLHRFQPTGERTIEGGSTQVSFGGQVAAGQNGGRTQRIPTVVARSDQHHDVVVRARIEPPRRPPGPTRARPDSSVHPRAAEPSQPPRRRVPPRCSIPEWAFLSPPPSTSRCASRRSVLPPRRSVLPRWRSTRAVPLPPRAGSRHDARCSRHDARCSRHDVRCSRHDVRCSRHDVRCSRALTYPAMTMAVATPSWDNETCNEATPRAVGLLGHLDWTASTRAPLSAVCTTASVQVSAVDSCSALIRASLAANRAASEDIDRQRTLRFGEQPLQQPGVFSSDCANRSISSSSIPTPRMGTVTTRP